MRILLYEFVHAGGWREFGWDAPAASLRREGEAMLAAVAEDFGRLANVELLIARDTQDFSLANTVRSECPDWTLVIAPESGGALLRLCRQVEAAGGALLGPSSSFVQLTSDKHATAEQLAAAGVPVPHGQSLAAGLPLPLGFPYPAVLKPIDGAGSQDTLLVASPADAAGDVALPHNQRLRRLEQYCMGLPASVALICGGGASQPLLACEQRLSLDGRFEYLGGRMPLAANLSDRARELAAGAIGALPTCHGYVGVDLILGEDWDGRSDYVIEINPRLTTSYVGLRKLCRQNLAEAMVLAAQGVVPKLSWRSETIEFDSAGNVRQVGS